VVEALSDYAYDAEVAGVHYMLSLRTGVVQLSLGGFNDKLHVLLDAVTEKMRTLTEIPENIYSIVADSYEDEVKNQAFRSKPVTQCSMRFNELVNKPIYPAYKRYEVFKTLKREHLSGLAAKLFERCHVEALALGNMSPAEAQGLGAALARGLQLREALEVLPESAEGLLPAGPTLWSLKSTDEDDPNHAVYFRIQMKQDVETEILLSLLGQVLSPKFFDILRTQQQLGYIVQLGASPSSKTCYLSAVVQSEFSPDYVRSRIDAFLEDHKIFVQEKLQLEEFETCRAGLLSDMEMKPKNLQEEIHKYARYFYDRSYDFQRRERAIAFLKGPTCSLERLRAFARDEVWVAPRIYTQVANVMEKPDKPLPADATIPDNSPDLRVWTTHAETVEAFATTAEWIRSNTEVFV